VTAATWAAFLLEVEGLVLAIAVLVAQDVVGAGHHATGAPRAQTRGHDLFEQVLPVELLGHGRHAGHSRRGG
jgi:hypothetical protein